MRPLGRGRFGVARGATHPSLGGLCIARLSLAAFVAVLITATADAHTNCQTHACNERVKSKQSRHGHHTSRHGDRKARHGHKKRRHGHKRRHAEHKHHARRHAKHKRHAEHKRRAHHRHRDGHTSCRTRACNERIAARKWRRLQRKLAPEVKVMLARLRGCETRGIAFPQNYRYAGHHFGAYQYDWGPGSAGARAGFRVRPDLASPAEQDVRTARFYPSHRGEWTCRA